MNELKTALENAMNRQLEEYEKDTESCEFSRSFERKANRLIKSMDGRTVFYGHSVPLKKLVQLAFLVVILASLSTAAYAAISHSSFKVESYDTYSLIKTTDISDAPLTLEERYEIGADLSGYSYEIMLDEEHIVEILYTDLYNAEKEFRFCQMTKGSVQGKRLNTESFLQAPYAIDVNGCEGMYFQEHNGSHYVLFDNGDYFIEFVASKEFSQNEIIAICNSVQKAEQ